jgi:SAM-dependent methyltransferase
MSAKDRENNITKLSRNILSIPGRAVSLFLDSLKYWTPGGYRAEKYWGDRLSRYGFDIRGVGHKGLSQGENEEMYAKAKETFLSLCGKEGVDFRNINMLDVGCGIGFYTKIFSENGGKRYLGVDITDTLFGALKRDFPAFQFRKLDISSQGLEGNFDLIIMIDVTQHITNSEKFSLAMQNVRSHLSEKGVFIVTSSLKKRPWQLFHEVLRSMDAYKKEFPGYAFSEPIPFRDKYIFTIRSGKA